MVIASVPKKGSGNIFPPESTNSYVILYYESGEELEQLPREAVDALFLEVFKARSDGTLGSLGWY